MSQRPLRILLTDPHSAGGGQVRYLQSLAGELVRNGHAVTIGCRANSVLVQIARDLGAASVPDFHFARGLRLAQWRHDLRRLDTLIRDEAPDIVHVNGSQDHWVAGLVQARRKKSFCLIRTRHNTYPVKTGLPNRLLNARWTTRQIAVCEMVRASLAQHPAFVASRLRAIHNGVDTNRYHPDPVMRQEARAAFGYTEKDLVCGIAARLVVAKGHTFLLQAVARLQTEIPTLRVLILGQGTLEEALRREVHDRGLDSRVQFGGFRDDMPRCVQAFDFGVLPSIDCDTSSFSLKEQMAAGLPVITSDYGGLPEIVTDGVEGLVVPNGTVRPLADAIARLAANPALRHAMGLRGRDRVLKDFSLEAFASRTVDLYIEALASGSTKTNGFHA
jgi:glycosyltransferase involved in cell wall biosynthesis